MNLGNSDSYRIINLTQLTSMTLESSVIEYLQVVLGLISLNFVEYDISV